MAAMQVSIYYFIFLLIGLLAGCFIGWFISRRDLVHAETNGRAIGVEAVRKETSEELGKLHKDVSDLREANGRLSADIAAKQNRLIELENATRQLSTERDGLLHSQSEFKAKIAELNTVLDKERTHGQEKLTLLNEAREQLSNQFKALANEILDEKSKKFTDQNQTNIGQLLKPLEKQLTEFKAKIEEVYINEGKDRSVLTEQVKQIILLNNTLSQDAQNLTLALKGDNKAQGNWGEIILDDVLERAGFIEGQHYDRQGSIKSEDGQSHVIPDVVIHLPGEQRERHLVIDAKMTLPDYRAFASAENDGERGVALKKHLTSVRTHIKGLSEKNYQSLYGLKSLDFVVMFIPLEPAFMLAVTNDPELFQQAWDKNVLLVSPSTLLFVVRTVAYLWRQEDLSRNAKDISTRGALLYDKFAGFVEDLQRVGEGIQQAQNNYDEALKKLKTGKGNVISQAQKLKELGVKPSKQLPVQWGDSAIDEASSSRLQGDAKAGDIERGGDGN